MVKHAANMCSCLGDTHSLSLFCHPAYTHTSPCHCEWNQVIQVQSDEEREDDEEIMMDDDEAEEEGGGKKPATKKKKSEVDPESFREAASKTKVRKGDGYWEAGVGWGWMIHTGRET